MNQVNFSLPIRVMLVDDHQTMLWGMQQLIDSKKPRMEVIGVASTAEEIMEKSIRLEPDVIVLDVDLGGKSSISLLPALLEKCKAKVLIFSGMRDEKILDSAILHGARGLVGKEEPANVLPKAIERIHAGELWLDRETSGRLFQQMHTQRNTKDNKGSDKLSHLTPKELKVLDLVVRESGLSNKALAQRLFMSEYTLRNHLSSIYHKLDVDNRLSLYVYASKLNLLSREI
ncbi:response regulator transcription factor [Oxalobacteraceae bacterium R-40]|uniref:Response regulator transcription factor n=1 Tax=Keguizhuia sedimenti TaxID=3064264 RepID=A0ABU1BLH2_9BURK|nr:response regulator transcription factor [Oxalobacteraceae bacterium R-40]